MFAGDGDNQIDTGAGFDTVEVGDGDNVVNTGSEFDLVMTGDGDNRFEDGDEFEWLNSAEESQAPAHDALFASDSWTEQPAVA